MVLTKLLVSPAAGVSMVGMWHLYGIGALPPMALLIKTPVMPAIYADLDFVYQR